METTSKLQAARDTMATPSFLTVPFGPLGQVCRLGLATRGGTDLCREDIHHAIKRGVNFLNWCGSSDALSQTIAGLHERRREVVVCVQFDARRAEDAERELAHILQELHTGYVDILTFYYVEEASEWQEISGPGGALQFCRQAQEAGQVRLLGLTSHQRPLAARVAESGLLDMVMIRYNAAHRGAETDVFPSTTPLKMPVVVYTCLRWGALLQGTPEDPPDFTAPRASAWYRFALQHPAVSVALMAPQNRVELEEDLTTLDEDKPLSAEEFERLAEHGRRVRKYAGSFP
jgi:predicted aldo/keto reductase-like oxidoreductase